MKTRNTLIALAAAAATVTGLAAPAFAAPRTDAAVTVRIGSNDRWDDRNDRWDHNRRDDYRRDDRAERQIDNRIDNLRDRIDMGRRNGQISRREANRLEDRLRAIVSLKRQYERSGRGLDRREVATLDSRLDSLSSQIRVERRDRNRW